ncbi:MAG TPA: hypothetical protein VK841_22375 [Polyangiaceae bacterium]|jgi:hypothetical protein|nr:hypothetical protein [Polyangiaceae bacterium]
MKSIHRASLPVFVLAAAALVPVARVAHADPNNPTPEDKAAARPFAIEGLRLAQAGDCKGAVDKLERGEALVHAPTTAVPLAQCDIQLGHIVAGTEILNRVINETLPANAPASWAESKQQAKGILDAASPRIGKLRIHVDLPPGVTPNPEVTVDGQLVPNVLLDNDRPTDPGTHRVTARQQGFGSAEADVTLLDGQSKPVALQLSGGGGAAGAVAAPPGQAAAGGADPYGGQGAAVATAPGASHTEPSASGSENVSIVALDLGARFGAAFPFGNAIGGNGNDLDNAISNQIIPLWLDLGVRLADNWYVGSYLSFGVASLGTNFNAVCNTQGVGCSGNDVRWGIEGTYHFLPNNRVDPWLGVGFGYEWLSFSQSQGNASQSEGLSGWELGSIQTGLDIRALDGFPLGIGPFAQFSFNEYTNESGSNSGGGSTGASINNQAVHFWLMFGVRGEYDLKFHTSP